jgi:hypothetical protein
VCCFNEDWMRKHCAAEGCTRQSFAIDRMDTSILSYAGNCQPLGTQSKQLQVRLNVSEVVSLSTDSAQPPHMTLVSGPRGAVPC